MDVESFYIVVHHESVSLTYQTQSPVSTRSHGTRHILNCYLPCRKREKLLCHVIVLCSRGARFRVNWGCNTNSKDTLPENVSTGIISESIEWGAQDSENESGERKRKLVWSDMRNIIFSFSSFREHERA